MDTTNQVASIRLSLSIAVGILVVVCIGLLGPPAAEEPVSLTPKVAPYDPEPYAQASEDEESSDGTMDREVLPEATPITWALRGKVHTPDGRRIPGVRLVLGEGEGSAELVSGSDGELEADVPLSLAAAPLTVRDEDWTGLTWSRPTPDLRFDVIVVESAVISGRIVDHTATAVSVGEVYLVLPSELAERHAMDSLVVHRSSLTSKGEFQMAGAPLEGSSLFYAGPNTTATLPLSPHNRREILWRLPAPREQALATRSGRVLSPDGNPLPGATVKLANRSTTSLADGSFRLEVPRTAIRPTDSIVAYKRGVGGVGLPAGLATVEHPKPIELRLRAIRRVECTLLWDDSSPIEEAVVALGVGTIGVGIAQPRPTLESLSCERIEARTDSNGRFELDILAGGEYSARIELEGRPGRIDVGTIQDQPGPQILVLPRSHVQQGFTLEVTDASGAPIAGVTVRTRALADPHAEVSAYLSSEEGQTDKSGRCHIDPLPRENTTVQVELPSGRSLSRPVRVGADGIMPVRIYPQIEVLVEWSSRFPTTSRLTVHDAADQPLWFEVITRHGSSTTTELPGRREGTRTRLRVDDRSAWLVLAVPGETPIRVAVIPGSSGEAEARF